MSALYQIVTKTRSEDGRSLKRCSPYYTDVQTMLVLIDLELQRGVGTHQIEVKELARGQVRVFNAAEFCAAKKPQGTGA